MLELKEGKRIARNLIKINPLIIEMNRNLARFKERMRMVDEIINPKMVGSAKNIRERMNEWLYFIRYKKRIDVYFKWKSLLADIVRIEKKKLFSMERLKCILKEEDRNFKRTTVIMGLVMKGRIH
jgi:hypothetical protein